MKFLNIESPFMQALGRVADLMWLNVLTILLCLPVVTAGAAFTSLHYMCLKIVRNEESYITKGYFKSFKENFKQSTIIWLLFLVAVAVLAGDWYIMRNFSESFNKTYDMILRVGLFTVSFIVACTVVWIFPMQARFVNKIKTTIKNAFFGSILQFPKTILMIVLLVSPLVIGYFVQQIFPIVILFCFSGPAFGAAALYNKFFMKLEAHITDRDAKNGEVVEESEFDKLEKSIMESDVTETQGITPIFGRRSYIPEDSVISENLENKSNDNAQNNDNLNEENN